MSYKREFVVGNSNTFVCSTIKTTRTERRAFEFIPNTNKVYSNRRRINIFEVINDRRIQSFLCRCENTPHRSARMKKSLNERPEKSYIKKSHIYTNTKFLCVYRRPIVRFHFFLERSENRFTRSRRRSGLWLFYGVRGSYVVCWNFFSLFDDGFRRTRSYWDKRWKNKIKNSPPLNESHTRKNNISFYVTSVRDLTERCQKCILTQCYLHTNTRLNIHIYSRFKIVYTIQYLFINF